MGLDGRTGRVAFGFTAGTAESFAGYWCSWKGSAIWVVVDGECAMDVVDIRHLALV